MKRILIVLPIILAAIAFPRDAAAGSLSIKGYDPANPYLYISSVQVGIGNYKGTYTYIWYDVFANASATYACYNNGGNIPTSKVVVSEPVGTGPVSFYYNSTNGKYSQDGTSLFLTPPPSGTSLTCPPGQVLKLSSVTYYDIIAHDFTQCGPTGNNSPAPADPDPAYGTGGSPSNLGTFSCAIPSNVLNLYPKGFTINGPWNLPLSG